jgi:hypothetical protein
MPSIDDPISRYIIGLLLESDRSDFYYPDRVDSFMANLLFDATPISCEGEPGSEPLCFSGRFLATHP